VTTGCPTISVYDSLSAVKFGLILLYDDGNNIHLNELNV
jgi:hypothetical protein